MPERTCDTEVFLRFLRQLGQTGWPPPACSSMCSGAAVQRDDVVDPKSAARLRARTWQSNAGNPHDALNILFRKDRMFLAVCALPRHLCNVRDVIVIACHSHQCMSSFSQLRGRDCETGTVTPNDKRQTYLVAGGAANVCYRSCSVWGQTHVDSVTRHALGRISAYL